jgi:uncharacterized protein (TIGR02594 family)
MYGRKNLALAFCGAALMAATGQAAAKPLHRHARAVAAQAKIETHVSPTDQDMYTHPVAPVAQSASATRKTRRAGRRAAIAQANAQAQDSASLFGGGDLVAEARRYLGSNPTGRRSLWCGAFMDKVLRETGHRGGGNLARAYAHYGTRIAGPQVGAIAVMARHGGGHVGVVSGIDASGNPIIISGNHNNTVAEAVYPRGRIIAYVMPN